MLSLADHLRHRQRGAYRALERALEDVDDEQALAGVDPAWKRHRWGTGLDGSVAGIVRHVATWKNIVAVGLDADRFPAESEVQPPDTTWPGLHRWLREGQRRLAAALEPLSDADLARNVVFEGEEMTVANLMAHLIEHDQYHAGQINLLRQLRGHMEW